MSETTDSGPYVQAASLCDQVIEGKDGTMSIIRLIDRFHVAVAGPTADREPIPAFNLMMVIMLKPGDARGTHALTIALIPPSGLVQSPMLTTTVFFEGEDRGVNVLLPFSLQVESEGMHWFDVRFNGRTLTRIPLRILVQRQLVAQS